MSGKGYQYEITEFGRRLKEERKKKNLTQLDLEVACGISRTEISKIENEFSTIIKLAQTLDVETFQLFQYE
jgi:transcriptional regulator with XRE-family HTH domain